MKRQTKKFKTEVQQLLNLVIHSLYSKHEIFLRELISNASDAIDRRRFEALTGDKTGDNDWQGRIIVTIDRQNRQLSIADNGTGMDAAELAQNIGTIASSGTRSFLQTLQENQKGGTELIGQFGVGFYSAFMVADLVTVLSKRAGIESSVVKWESNGAGTFTIEESDQSIDAGTKVILHLKDEMDCYLDPAVIKRVIKEYSDYIAYPVMLNDGTGKEDEQVNSQKALWKQPRDLVSDEQYSEFYRHITHDHADPLGRLHIAAEGTVEFKALLFIPSKAQIDLFRPDYNGGVQLYVNNVFITDQCRDLLPEYLRFIRGVVDSSDLPLNVSREILQNDRNVHLIKKNVVSRILGYLAETMKEQRETYDKFWREFGCIIKEGCHPGNNDLSKLTGLLLFKSTQCLNDKFVSLAEYIERMQEGQQHIYYLSSDSDAALHSPHLEVFSKRGIEVLLMDHPVDDFMLMHLSEYDGHMLKPVDRGDLDLPAGKDDKEQAGGDDKQTDKPHSDLLRKLQDILAGKVSDVRISKRLTDSACCLVAHENSLPSSLEQMMRSMNQPVPTTNPVLEINPEHPVLQITKQLFENNPRGEELASLAEVLYAQAGIANGILPEDPGAFNRKIWAIARKAYAGKDAANTE